VDELSILGREAVERALLPSRARDAIGAALLMGESRPIARTSLAFGDGELLVMPAEDRDLAGVKILTLAPGFASSEGPAARVGTTSTLARADTPGPHAQGIYVLFEARSLTPVLLLDGAALTELRTAAVSAWATDVLAPRDAKTLLLFGSGPQAHAHLRALADIRSLEEMLLVSPDERSASELLALAESMGIKATRAGAGEVGRADIVCCCTTSPVPVFDGKLLRPGTHVVAIGSHLPDRRELDTATVLRSVVVVETRASALAGAGDLIIPIKEGAWSGELVAADLFELARGHVPPRDGHDVTLFKSVGVAFEDLAMARAVLETLRTSSR
jgi:ornithine cyclodeaminase